MANMLNQLVFMFGPDPPSYGPWQITERMAEWSAEMEELLPSLYAPFGQRDAIAATVTDAAQGGLDMGPLALPSDLRARAWQENPSCAHVVVVNANTSFTARPTVTLTGAVGGLAGGRAARLFDACYEVPLTQAQAQGAAHFADFVGPESANVYRLGTNCTDTTEWKTRFARARGGGLHVEVL
jgi:hypothetical protein|eukprot:COSAG01_NODE_4960_length_4589_cov_2.312249_4_plen_183_part_00